MNNGDKCPLCQKPIETRLNSSCATAKCGICKEVVLEGWIVSRPSGFANVDWKTVFAQAREHWEVFGVPMLVSAQRGATGEIELTCKNIEDEIVAPPLIPQSLREKAMRLLRLSVKKSAKYGDALIFTSDDYLLGYCSDFNELKFIIDFLQDLGLVENKKNRKPDICFRITAKGHEAVESTALLPPTSVFISSTVYDLLDCRAELAKHLEDMGCVIYMSDDPSRFEQSYTENSIETCKMNIRNSDFVICIVDQRYGPPLRTEGYGDKSATEVEIDEAKSHGKPICYFIRDVAFNEYSTLKKDHHRSLNWVEVDCACKDVAEKRTAGQREKWVNFVASFAALKGSQANWVNAFHTVVDLKQVAAKRIMEFRRSSQ